VGYELHVVRTREWSEAAKKPILKSEVDMLIARDRELKWSQSDFEDMRDKRSGKVIRYFMIEWQSQSAFWWYQDQIYCKNPNELQQRKLVQIARTLKAMVIGDEGERYEISKGFLGGEKIVILPWPK